MQAPFSKKELFNTIESCNNSSTSRPDKLSWRYLKEVVKNKECTNKLINIVNACIDLGYWPTHFKTLFTVIIPKPNKALYDSPKLFCPIVLLNITDKLFEKMIGKRLQFLSISNNFVHLYQLDRLKHRFTTDVDVILTHLIKLGWVKNLTMSILAFDITQFFPLLNYQILSLILAKAGFQLQNLKFFQKYLIDRKTKYLWNSFSFPFCNIDIGIDQGSAFFTNFFSSLSFSNFLYSGKIIKKSKNPYFNFFFH